MAETNPRQRRQARVHPRHLHQRLQAGHHHRDHASALALNLGSALIGQCISGTGGDLYLSLGNGASGTWWNLFGAYNFDNSAIITQLSPRDFMVVAQVTEGSAVSTYIASQAYNSSTETCTFTAQLLTTGK
jgi:hypothetical protein